MREKVIMQHHFVNMTDGLQEQILNRVWGYFETMGDGPLRPYLLKPDAEIKCVINMTKNKQDKYDGTIALYLDSAKPLLYETDTNVPFKEPLDIVNHAFLHFKEHLADAKH